MKLTATEIDVLTLATEKPEPIPLPLSVAGLPVNPMLWPADWSVQVSLQTRWQTDITKPFQGGRTEAQILASRPSRKLRISMVGATKAECHAMIQTCLEHSTVFGAPVPIYPDAVSLQSVAGQDPNNTYIYGDFRYRRFFEGGRVVFMPGRVDPNQRALSAVFGTILAWVLVRYDFPFRKFIDALVDFPFALPTAVAGLTLANLFAGGCFPALLPGCCPHH